MTRLSADRRPLSSRDTGWARAAVQLLARTSITPNQVSLLTLALWLVVAGGVLTVARRSYSMVQALNRQSD